MVTVIEQILKGLGAIVGDNYRVRDIVFRKRPARQRLIVWVILYE